MSEFFQTNHDIVYFIYGEAFFVLGLAVALQSRKHSQLLLAKRLWLLAVFGIVHGIYEWGTVFIPIQQTYLPASIVSVLRVLQLLVGAVSFLALFQFGIELLILHSRRWRAVGALPAIVFFVWAVVVLIAESELRVTLDQVLVLAEVLYRYGLAIPGAVTSAWGLLRQAQQVQAMDLPRISSYFRFAAYAFGVYALLSMFVPRGDFFPASVLNYDAVIQAIGIPVPVFRAIAGTTIAYLIIRGSEIFDIETDRLLEEIARARAVSADRERIGRELHDNIIQSLYASGLMLEDASLTVDEDAARAKDRIREVTGALNRTIGDIRRYILDLRGENEAPDWQQGLRDLVRNFHLETLMDAELHVEGNQLDALTREQGDQVLAVAREALTNVSKHAQATRVDLTLAYRSDEIELEIADNGVGLVPNGHGPRSAGEGQGIRNMTERAQLIGGTLAIERAPDHGTIVRLIVPMAQRNPIS